MKKSRKERKAYNEGKAYGYQEGYAKGLHDGNPFVIAAEAIQKAITPITDFLKSVEAPSLEAIIEESKERNEEDVC